MENEFRVMPIRGRELVSKHLRYGIIRDCQLPVSSITTSVCLLCASEYGLPRANRHRVGVPVTWTLAMTRVLQPKPFQSSRQQ